MPTDANPRYKSPSKTSLQGKGAQEITITLESSLVINVGDLDHYYHALHTTFTLTHFINFKLMLVFSLLAALLSYQFVSP